MTRIKRGAFSAAFLCGLLAGVPRADAQEVTVEQLVALALERSPELQAARADIAVAGGQVTQAALRPNPMLSTSHEHEPGGMTITGAEVAWPLDLFRRPARVAVARGMADVTTLAIRDRERLLASAVREQAGRVLAERRTLELTNEALTAARRMRDLLDRRVTEGGSTKIDANLAAVEALRLEADAAIAAGEIEATTIQLKALVGLAADAPLALGDSLETRAAAPAVPRLTPAAAIETRPDLREAIARIGLADARAEQARRDARSEVSLVGGWTRNHWVFPQLGLDERGRTTPIQNTFHTYTVGATVSLPFSNRNQGTLASAQAERQGAEALFAARQRAARADIDAALARERQARRAVEIYATTARELARQNVDVMLEGYDLGRFPLSDVLAEQRRYLDVEAGYTAVLSRAYDARAAVARAFGETP
ncbi:MAG: TolC family protein [Acidobacteria bacterium]|nr:TolC family protein [Acidobacteriota bacterium]